MNESLFSKYIAKFFPILQTLIEKINGKRTAPTYLFKENLKKEYAVDNKWSSTSINTTYVAADFVALDSPLPPKSRDSIATASGELPKLGMIKYMKESDLNALRIMEAQGGNQATIAQRLANDVVSCSMGIDEACEKAFLEGFSNGVVAIPDSTHPNGALRLDYGYLPEHTFGATIKGEVTISDIKRVLEYANNNGDTVTTIWIAKSTYDALRQTREAKELYASYVGQLYTDDTTLAVPNATRFNDAFADDNSGVRFKIVDRSVKEEKNGKRVSIKPWNAEHLIFACNDVVGSLVYGRLAEATSHVKNVEYTTVDDYKLISKYSTPNPFREYTSAQAIVAPVIEDVDQLYMLDISEAQAVDSTMEASDTNDAKVTVWGNTYKKPEFVAELNKLTGKALASTTTDDKIITAVNKLSNAQESALKSAVESQSIVE